MKLPEWAKWMARDKDGMLWMYSNKPEKYEERDVWYQLIGVGKYNIIDDLLESNFPHVKWSDEEPTEIINMTLEEKEVEFDPIEPDYYNKGEIDLYESWYLTRPFNEFRAILESIAERYMKRDKNNRLEDIDKAIYTLQRLREYEVLELEKNLPPIEQAVEE